MLLEFRPWSLWDMSQCNETSCHRVCRGTSYDGVGLHHQGSPGPPSRSHQPCIYSGWCRSLAWNYTQTAQRTTAKDRQAQTRRRTHSLDQNTHTAQKYCISLFHQGSSSAGSEPEPSFKPVLCFSTPKAPAPNQEKWFVSSTKTLLG